MNIGSHATSNAHTGGCALCGAPFSRHKFFTLDRLALSDQRFSISECAGCGVWRTLPEMSEPELSFFYPQGYWGSPEEPSPDWIRSSQEEKTSFLKQCGLSGGRILDVGCGAGYFLRALDERSWDRYGIEISPTAAGAAAARLGSDRIHGGTILEVALPASFFDVVTLWSTLEHTNEPQKNLNQARRLLKNGGTVIVQVPNAASYQARWFGGDWFALDAPRHRFHFSWRALSQLLSETGFEVYHRSFWSKAHNVHALRQSLKCKWRVRESIGNYVFFCLTIPFLKPLDTLMTVMDEGATVTVAARAV